MEVSHDPEIPRVLTVTPSAPAAIEVAAPTCIPLHDFLPAMAARSDWLTAPDENEVLDEAIPPACRTRSTCRASGQRAVAGTIKRYAWRPRRCQMWVDRPAWNACKPSEGSQRAGDTASGARGR